MGDWKEIWFNVLDSSAKNSIDIKETKIGVVQNVSPLQICIGDLVLYAENLYVNTELIEHERQFTIPTQSATGSTSGTVPDSAVVSVGFSNKKIIMHNRIKVGDLVALRKLPYEKYYVENIVVKGEDVK